MATDEKRSTGRRWAYVLLAAIPLTVTNAATAP